jgi:hypothetical protein
MEKHFDSSLKNEIQGKLIKQDSKVQRATAWQHDPAE